MGVTLADFQSEGNFPWSSDAWKINVSSGAICCAVSLSNRVGMLSGPAAL